MGNPQPYYYYYESWTDASDPAVARMVKRAAEGGEVEGYPVTDPENPNNVIGWCGNGRQAQPVAMLQYKSPEYSFHIFSRARQGLRHDWPELDDLSTKMNEEFTKRATVILDQKRKKTGLKNLEITWWFGHNGLQLAYALPAAKRRIAVMENSVLRLLWLKIKLRIFRHKPNLPDSGSPTSPKKTA